MVQVLTGENAYLLSQKLSQIKDDFVKSYGDFGIEQYDAGDTSLGRLVEAVSSMPFLSEKRMVIVHSLSTNKEIINDIEHFLDSVSGSTELVIVESKFDKRLTLYKALKKRTEMFEFSELDERALAKWAVEYVSSIKGSIKPNDVEFLIARVGINQVGLKNELDKLVSFDTNITRDSIEMLTEPLLRSSVFDLLDAAFAGNRQKTLSLYDDQRRQQVEPQAIMGMIAWQVHILAVVKLNEKDGADTIAKSAKLNPFVVRKAMNLTRNLSEQQVKDLVARTLELDVRLKSEQIDADDAVQHFLLTI